MTVLGGVMQEQEQSTTGLKSNVASTLAYFGAWISGIVFLALEKKDNIVRFNAMQSIVTFGMLLAIIVVLSFFGTWFGLGVWGGAFGPVGIIITILQSLLFAFSIILWILLMVRSYQGERTVLPLAGDISLALLRKMDSSFPDVGPAHFRFHQREDGRAISLNAAGSRAGRVAGSIAAIVSSVFFFVLFNFYPDYIAFYQGMSEGGVSQLLRYPVLTAELVRVLPVINLTLGLTVVLHVIALAVDGRVLREVIEIVLHVMGAVTALVWLKVFPFDYSQVPMGEMVNALPTITVVVLVIVALGMGVDAIVRLVRLVTGLK
ncbi:MAG: hypothetical protein JW846_05850 [Dehalococcoidia bacterium]|nr:hypothetical protein [Dehalococcoidia bacterium]